LGRLVFAWGGLHRLGGSSGKFIKFKKGVVKFVKPIKDLKRFTYLLFNLKKNHNHDLCHQLVNNIN
jgi:hypothetical protein